MIEHIVVIILLGVIFWLWVSRFIDRQEHNAHCDWLTGRTHKAEAELEKLKDMLSQKVLTQRQAKAEDAPKRLSGPQLRRMNDAVNNADVAALIERPNSEILKEQSNG